MVEKLWPKGWCWKCVVGGSLKNVYINKREWRKLLTCTKGMWRRGALLKARCSGFYHLFSEASLDIMILSLEIYIQFAFALFSGHGCFAFSFSPPPPLTSKLFILHRFSWMCSLFPKVALRMTLFQHPHQTSVLVNINANRVLTPMRLRPFASCFTGRSCLSNIALALPSIGDVSFALAFSKAVPFSPVRPWRFSTKCISVEIWGYPARLLLLLHALGCSLNTESTF